ncbi:hypothetical protein [Halorussus salinisoli]|uniref:hypothetical protein n=1 Tax=Halorussus salinisoli TaxID=2558242 RepID=UPI0010C1CAC3|nr:hypothetical protein [Halorussus salinisoli]
MSSERSAERNDLRALGATTDSLGALVSEANEGSEDAVRLPADRKGPVTRAVRGASRRERAGAFYPFFTV